MAAARKELGWRIKKKLFQLSGTETYHLARDIATDSQGTNILEPSDEEGCVEYILSYVFGRWLADVWGKYALCICGRNVNG